MYSLEMDRVAYFETDLYRATRQGHLFGIKLVPIWLKNTNVISWEPPNFSQLLKRYNLPFLKHSFIRFPSNVNHNNKTKVISADLLDFDFDFKGQFW